MQTAHDRVTTCLDLLTRGLLPFVERSLKEVYKDDWIEAARSSFRDDVALPEGAVMRWDAYTLLTVVWDHWNSVFRDRLGQFERSLISELRDFRNRWAHQATFDFDDTYRILDSTQRLLRAVGARETADVARVKRELMQGEFAEQVNRPARKRAFSADKWTVISLSLICGTLVVYVILTVLGRGAWPFAMVVALLFVYVIYQRLVAEEPAIGPHECKRCGRIIYSDPCPYCEPPVSNLTSATS